MTSRQIFKLDASNQSIGRLATQIALILRGKNNVSYQPHLDLGGVILINNIAKIKYTGKKAGQKKYHSYSGYPGGLKTRKISDLKPADILTRAVRDMLPANKHRVNMLKRLIIN